MPISGRHFGRYLVEITRVTMVRPLYTRIYPRLPMLCTKSLWCASSTKIPLAARHQHRANCRDRRRAGDVHTDGGPAQDESGAKDCIRDTFGHDGAIGESCLSTGANTGRPTLNEEGDGPDRNSRHLADVVRGRRFRLGWCDDTRLIKGWRRQSASVTGLRRIL